MTTSPLARALALLAISAASMNLRAQEPASPPADKDPVTTKSGLIYSILEAGQADGRKPKLGDTVKVHYKGWLDDGSSFDNSFSRGQPAQFKLGQVIEGWNEGLGYATKGAKIKLVIPSALAYGETGRPSIPANSRLTFYVELLDVIPGPPVPDFKAFVDEGATKSEKGFHYRLEAKGEGEAIRGDQSGAFELTCWTEDGRMVLCHTADNGGLIRGKPSGFDRLPFLAPAMTTLPVGAVGWFAVEAGQDWPVAQRPASLGKTARSIWRIKLLEIVQGPKFRDLDPAKTVKTASGLEYEVIKQGSGDAPKATSTVQCHYAGWLMDGTSFDSSYDRGEPTSFPLSGVIAGWTEGLQLMQPGAVYLFRIPYQLGYGEAGNGPIPARATLIFQVELISVL